MYKHILVALDGSDNATPALLHAIDLAAFHQSKLTLAHVASLHDYAVEGVGLLDNEELYKQSRERAQSILNKAEEIARTKGVVDIEKYCGDDWEGMKHMAELLVQFAQDKQADVMVVGTHGRSGLMHLLMGSFAQTVVRLSTVPVLVVRNATDDEDA